MGDPRRLRSTFSGPGHPWQSARIEEEKGLFNEYGLKNKRELRIMNSKLKSFADQAKRLIALRTEQADVEAKQLLGRLARLGVLPADAQLNDVLSLTVKDLLDRRLQTVVFKKGFARTSKQSRQFIVHEHVTIGGKKITAPGYLVPVAEETQISFVGNSSLANEEHPERAIKSKPVAKIAKEAKAEAKAGEKA